MKVETKGRKLIKAKAQSPRFYHEIRPNFEEQSGVSYACLTPVPFR